MPSAGDPNWFRFCITIAGFQEEFGVWPTRVLIQPNIHAHLMTLFPDEDLERLKSHLDLGADPGTTYFTAIGDHGQALGYFEVQNPNPDLLPVLAWLGVEPHPRPPAPAGS
jgi:hypothetical protein